MMISTLFFYSINSIILVYFILRLIKNYFIPSLQQERAEKELKIQYINEKMKSFQIDVAHITHEIYEQQQLYATLEKKVIAWRIFVEDQNLMQKLQDNKNYELLEIKRNIQQGNFAYSQAYAAVLPQVIEKTRQELKKELEGNKSHDYINRILKKLKHE